MAKKSIEELAAQAKGMLRDNEDMHIDIDTEITDDNHIRVRRTVWKRAHRLRDRDIVEQTTLMELTQDQAVDLIRDLAGSLRFAEGTF